MTPELKAKELIDRFILVNSESVELETGEYELLLSLSKEDAKQCALVAVDEIIKMIKPQPVGIYLLGELVYFERVKKEIERL